MTSSRVAEEAGIRSLARILAYATAGVEPKDVLIAPIHAMKRRDARRSLASLCLGGGNAVAMIAERM